MSTVRLNAEAKFGYSGQYIAKIIGRAERVQFNREFVGSKSGKRGESTSYEIDESGLYEECDVGKNGKSKSFALVLPWTNRHGVTSLQKLYSDLEDALAIAQRIDGGECLEEFVRFERGGVLTDKYYYSVCHACGVELKTHEKCPDHPTTYTDTLTRTVPRTREDGTPEHELVYRIIPKGEVKKAEVSATLESATAAIVATLAALPAPLQRKALAAAKAQLFPPSPKGDEQATTAAP